MFLPVDLASHASLRAMLGPLAAGAEVDHYSLDGQPYDRRRDDGIIALRIRNGRTAFGAAVGDFRLKGGSYSRLNSERLSAFIDEMGSQDLPLVLLVDSMGVRLMDGRAVVKPAFGVIPHLLRFRESHLLVTCNLGRALGLGAVLYAAGHCRLAVSGRAFTNLAGPEVMRMFFRGSEEGDAPSPPAEPPGPEPSLAGDEADTRDAMLSKARAIVECAGPPGEPEARAGADEPAEFPSLSLSIKPEAKLRGIVAAFGESSVEVFANVSPSVRSFIVTRHGRRFGLFVNPPGNPDNLVTAAALDRYLLGLDLFRVLRLPIVSLLDTPGGDPRDNAEVVHKFWQTAQRIIEYPYRRMGVVIGRGYGGAIMLGFPRFFGSDATFVLEGASLGQMHPHIIDSLLAASKRLAADWDAAKAAQTRDCTDIVAAGIIHGVIQSTGVLPALDRFLRGEPAEAAECACG